MERRKATQPGATRVVDPILALISERERLARLQAEAEVRGEDDKVLDALALEAAYVELAVCDTPATTIAGAIARLGMGVALMHPSRAFIRGPEERATAGALADLRRLLPDASNRLSLAHEKNEPSERKFNGKSCQIS